jgi:hypothetical protein
MIGRPPKFKDYECTGYGFPGPFQLFLLDFKTQHWGEDEYMPIEHLAAASNDSGHHLVEVGEMGRSDVNWVFCHGADILPEDCPTAVKTYLYRYRKEPLSVGKSMDKLSNIDTILLTTLDMILGK